MRCCYGIKDKCTVSFGVGKWLCGLGLATAVGLLATQAGYRVRCFEAAALVLMLKAAVADNRLESTLRDIHRADLLIIDEFGYLTVDVDGARLLYQVMAATYGSRSMIVTTNIEFSRWGTVLGDLLGLLRHRPL